VADTSDPDPRNPNVCGDADGDSCDDCTVGVDGFGPASDSDPANDGVDTDSDGLCDLGDPDDDNDGVADSSDVAPQDPNACSDADSDGCDDCAVGTDDFGPMNDFDPANDGADADGDGLCDSGDPDDDNDGVSDVQDCAPFDPTASASPSEVSDLVVDATGSTTLVWSDQGTGFGYDVITGTFSALALDAGVDSAICLIDDVAGNTAVDPRADPAPGSGLYYLVRSNNVCGAGTFGTASSLVERLPAAACP